MLDSLLAYLEDPNSEERFVRLDSLEFIDFDGIVVVSSEDYYGTETFKQWQLTARGLRDYDVSGAYGELTLLDSQHVLSKQHTDTRQQLMFRGVPKSVSEAIGELLVAHRKMAGTWIPFFQYLNGSCPLEDLLKGGFGQLADGPTFLLEGYANTLSDLGIHPSLVAERASKWFDGSSWIDMAPELFAVTIGNAYFVAESFEVHERAA